MGYIDDQEQKMILSNNLAYYIELYDKDQKQIAIDLDINPPTLNQWIRGKAIPSVSTLKRLAAYFNVGLGDLVNAHTDDVSKINLSQSEQELIKAYRAADLGIKQSVDILLKLKKED